MRSISHATAFSGEESRRRLNPLFTLSAAFLMLLCGTTLVPAQNATLVSVNKNGSNSGNGLSATSSGTVSADGRLVAFVSKAGDLTAVADDNATYDVFVRNLTTGVTTLVSMNASGMGAGNGVSGVTSSQNSPP